MYSASLQVSLRKSNSKISGLSLLQSVTATRPLGHSQLYSP